MTPCRRLSRAPLEERELEDGGKPRTRQIGEQFRILDPARVPLKPRSPNRMRINGLATLAGLGWGCCWWCWWSSRFDDAVRGRRAGRHRPARAGAAARFVTTKPTRPAAVAACDRSAAPSASCGLRGPGLVPAVGKFRWSERRSVLMDGSTKPCAAPTSTPVEARVPRRRRRKSSPGCSSRTKSVTAPEPQGLRASPWARRRRPPEPGEDRRRRDGAGSTPAADSNGSSCRAPRGRCSVEPVPESRGDTAPSPAEQPLKSVIVTSASPGDGQEPRGPSTWP